MKAASHQGGRQKKRGGELSEVKLESFSIAKIGRKEGGGLKGKGGR